jgi:peptide/nickel transport system permease protein
VTFLIRRIILTIPILLLVTVMVFSLIHLIPGDVATVVLGQEATPAAKVALRHRLGLDKPLPVQYASWLGNVLHGNLGDSLTDGTPVMTEIKQRLPVTAELALASFIVAILIAIPSGIVSAVYRGKAADYAATLFAFLGMSVPGFWLAMLMIILFALRLGWLPSSGFVPFTQDPAANLRAMILPAFATGVRESAVLMRMMRSSLLEVMSQDYVRTARGKGLTQRAVIFGHGIRNALIPVITQSGLLIAGLLGGLVITETLFQIPGFGKMIVTAIFERDFITVQGAVLVSALLVVLVNLLVDMLYGALDPRIRI